MNDAIVIDDPHYVKEEDMPSSFEAKPVPTPMRKGHYHMKSKSASRSRKSRLAMQKRSRRVNR